jgi:hypothetical protein
LLVKTQKTKTPNGVLEKEETEIREIGRNGSSEFEGREGEFLSPKL